MGVAAVAGLDLGRERGAAEGVVAARGVLEEGGEDAPHVREEQVAGAGIGLPLELHGVGEAEPLDGAVRAVERLSGAGVSWLFRGVNAGAGAFPRKRWIFLVAVWVVDWMKSGWRRGGERGAD